MNKKRYPPISLKIITYLSILFGISSLYDSLISLMTHNIKVNLGIIELFIGIGLFKGVKLWRNIALLKIWLIFIAVPFYMVLLQTHFIEFTFLKPLLKYTTINTLMIIGIVILIYNLWKFTVLYKKDVQTFFKIDSL